MVEKVQFVSEPKPVTLGQTGVSSRRAASGPHFDAVLREKLADGVGVQFSAHALRRLDSRGIQITPEERQLIEKGVRSAAKKGARESLLVTDRFALVVSVRNRTVITAKHADELDDGVFTNIDSAVICRAGSMAPQRVGVGQQMVRVHEDRLDLA
jgi:flagellar operon protein